MTSSPKASLPFLCIEGNPRPGTPFRPTTELVTQADLPLLASRLPGDVGELVFIREFPGPRGVADAVAVFDWREDFVRRRALNLTPIESQVDCLLVSAFHVHRTLTAQAVAERLSLSFEQVMRRTKRLSESGYLMAKGAGFRRVDGIAPIGRMYALEAKVSDWKRGMGQAVRYATWADAAAVALSRPPARFEETLNLYSRLNLGLAIDGEWVARPVVRSTNSALRLKASEEFFSHLMRLETF